MMAKASSIGAYILEAAEIEVTLFQRFQADLRKCWISLRRIAVWRMCGRIGLRRILTRCGQAGGIAAVARTI